MIGEMIYNNYYLNNSRNNCFLTKGGIPPDTVFVLKKSLVDADYNRKVRLRLFFFS